MNQCLSALSIDISGDCFSNNNGEDHACSGHHLPTVSIVSNENEATTLASHMMEEDDISNEELSEEEPKFDVKPCDRELNESEEVIQLFDEQLKSFDGDVDFIANVQFPRTFVFVHESKQSETIQTTQKLAVFQKSLFKNVQPTIYFGLEGEEIVHVQPELQQQMIWRLSSITPYLIRKAVVRSGFRLIKQNSTSTRWIGTWCKHLNCEMYGDLLQNQKVNHYPGSFNFGRKDKLWMNLSVLGVRLNSVRSVDFHPTTFILPNEIHSLKRQMEMDAHMKLILKPPASARGNGIQIINEINQIPKQARVRRKLPSNKTALIAQKYIENPLLLFNQTKFDIRMYVLVTSFEPLRMYVYDDGLVRFASVPYSNDINRLNDQFMHLTNYSINKKSSTYQVNEDENSLNGHKWTLKRFFSYVAENMPHIQLDLLCQRIIDLLLKTVISCQHSIVRLVKQHLKAKYNSYELLGFDIMLDANWKPWLIEVNISPSLRSESSVDTFVKGQLIKDMLNVVGYRLPVPYEDDLLNYGCTEEETIKHKSFVEQFNQILKQNFNNVNVCDQHDFGLTDQLTADDVRQLCTAEDELSRKGSFKRLFPSRVSQNYLKYFVEPHYYNYLLNEWNRKYANRRSEGIERLRSLCEESVNLRGIKGKLLICSSSS